MVVLLLSFLFMTNDGIGLSQGLLYTTHITQTFHMFIIYISNLMLQLTCSSIRPSPPKLACFTLKR
jgi:hypothetical protein